MRTLNLPSPREIESRKEGTSGDSGERKRAEIGFERSVDNKQGEQIDLLQCIS